MFEYREVLAPYPGLRPFEPYENEIFFGREGHTDRLLEILQRERFLAVIGPSGCGKSSLVRAGLLPGLASGALGTGSDWRLALMRPGSQPMLALAQSLLGPSALGRELVGEDRLPKDAEDFTADVALVAAELRQGKEGLVSLMQAAAARQPKGLPPFNLLVLVDQFEEIFTYAKAASVEGDESDAFIDLLLAARADVSSHVYVVLTMRTDFLGNCVRFLDLPEAINHAQYLTPRPGPKDMEYAIIGPARVFGGDVAAGLVPQLIESIGHDSDQLPILQHALARMWQVAEAINPVSPLIDADCAKVVGGVAEALNRHSDEVLASLQCGQQVLAENLFRAITERRENGGQDVRRPQTLSVIADWVGVQAEDLKPVILAFAAPEVSFLHYGRELADRSVIDLTHEALIRQWAKLREWVEDEFQRGQGYRRWSQRAAEYKDGGSLLTGGELARALDWWNPPLGLPGPTDAWQPSSRWAQRYSEGRDDRLNEEFQRTRRFLIDSRDAEKQEREREQRRLEEQAETERLRAEKERQLAEQALANAKRAEAAERRLTVGLFESQLTHGCLLARVEDFAEARRVLTESARLDREIRSARRHARNLLSGYAEMRSGRAEYVYVGAEAALSGGVAVSPDGKLLAAAGEHGTLVLFDAASGQLLLRLEGHRDPNAWCLDGVQAVVMDGQGRWMFSGGDDGRIIRWAMPSGEKLDEWQTPKKVNALALSPDGETLASGGTDNRVMLWNAANGTLLQTLEGHEDVIAHPNGLAFSADGSRLASASYDQTARIWDWQAGSSQVLRGHNGRVQTVAFSPDGKLLATASNDRQIILWDALDGNSVRILQGHQNIVFDVAFSPDGNQILSASRDNTLRLWDLASGIALRIFQGHEGGLWSVAVFGNAIYTAANDATVRRWTLDTPDQWVWETGGIPVAAAISPDGGRVALGMEDGSLRLYGSPDGTLLAEQADAHGSRGISRIAFNPEGRLLATAGMDHKAKLWRVEPDSGRLTHLHTFEGHTKEVYAVTFSPDGQTLATASYDGHIGLYDVVDGQGCRFPAHDGRVESVVFTPAGDHVLSAGHEDRRLRLWDLDHLSHPPREIAQAQDLLLWASVSPNGHGAAAVGREQTVSLYDLANPGVTSRLAGHEQAVFRVQYSPDGRQLASVGGDMTVRLWDLDIQRLLFTLRLPDLQQNDGPWDFDFRCTADGNCWIAVPLTIGRLALFRLPYDHPPAALQVLPESPSSA